MSAVQGPRGSTGRPEPLRSAEGPAQDALAPASSSWSRAGGRRGQAGGESSALGSLARTGTHTCPRGPSGTTSHRLWVPLGTDSRHGAQGHRGPDAGPGALPAAGPGPTLTLPASAQSGSSWGHQAGRPRRDRNCPPSSLGSLAGSSSVLGLVTGLWQPGLGQACLPLQAPLESFEESSQAGSPLGVLLALAEGSGGHGGASPKAEPGKARQSLWVLGPPGRSQPSVPFLTLWEGLLSVPILQVGH